MTLANGTMILTKAHGTAMTSDADDHGCTVDLAGSAVHYTWDEVEANLEFGGWTVVNVCHDCGMMSEIGEDHTCKPVDDELTSIFIGSDGPVYQGTPIPSRDEFLASFDDLIVEAEQTEKEAARAFQDQENLCMAVTIKYDGWTAEFWKLAAVATAYESARADTARLKAQRALYGERKGSEVFTVLFTPASGDAIEIGPFDSILDADLFAARLAEMNGPTTQAQAMSGRISDARRAVLAGPENWAFDDGEDDTSAHRGGNVTGPLVTVDDHLAVRAAMGVKTPGADSIRDILGNGKEDGESLFEVVTMNQRGMIWAHNSHNAAERMAHARMKVDPNRHPITYLKSCIMADGRPGDAYLVDGERILVSLSSGTL